MNIYLVEQDVNNGYDTYDAFVCFAESEDDARKMPPSSYVSEWRSLKDEWVDNPALLKVTLLGKSDSTEAKVVLASFNAG